MSNDRDLRAAIDEIANALQVIAPLSTHLLRTLGREAEDAVRLQAAVDRAVRALRRLQPSNGE